MPAGGAEQSRSGWWRSEVLKPSSAHPSSAPTGPSSSGQGPEPCGLGPRRSRTPQETRSYLLEGLCSGFHPVHRHSDFPQANGELALQAGGAASCPRLEKGRAPLPPA